MAFDILIRRSRHQNHPRRLRRWQIRERLEAHGPVQLRIELKMLANRPTRSQYVLVEPSWVAVCQGRGAVQRVREALAGMLRGLRDGTSDDNE
jgi:hypothetical protein